MSNFKIILVGPLGMGIAMMHRLQALAPDLAESMVVVSNDEPTTIPAPAVPSIPEPAVAKSLTLIEPLINCETHTIEFRTEGGDGTKIEFMGPGVTNWTSKRFARIDDGVWNEKNAQPLTLYARQSGQEAVPIRFDFRQKCPIRPTEPIVAKPVEIPEADVQPVTDSRPLPEPVLPIDNIVGRVIGGTLMGTGNLD